MLRKAVALITSGALLGCGASWPNHADALAVPQVHAVTTVDVLPIDLEVWTENGYPLTPDAVRDDASYQLISTAMEISIWPAATHILMRLWRGLRTRVRRDLRHGGCAMSRSRTGLSGQAIWIATETSTSFPLAAK